MKSRKANLGKPPDPFNGNFEQFCYDFDGYLPSTIPTDKLETSKVCHPCKPIPTL